WVYCGKDPETNYLEHIITNYAFRPILKEGYSYNPSTVPLLSLHIIEDRPLLRTIHNETSKLKIIRSEYEIPEKYRNFSFGAQTVLERKNINDVKTIYKTKYQRFIDGKTRDIWAKETALHVDSGMTSRYGNDQLLAVGAIGNQQNHKGSVTMRYDFYYYDDEENEVPIQLPGFMMIANLDKKSEYWNGTDIPDAVTPQEYEMCYVYEGNYLGINGDRIYGTDLIFAGNNQPEWGSDTWKKMLAIIAFDTSSITLKMEAGYARGIVIDSWEFNYKIETNVQNGRITPSEYGIIPGQNRTIAYTPYKGYELTKLEVDGERISLTNHLNEYSFTDIQENHEIYATFEKTYHIKTEVENGIIDESIHQIPEGESRAIHYKPNPGYILNTIEVDQEKVNQKDYKNEYLFSNITRDHHIKVSFVKQPDPIKKVKDNMKLMRKDDVVVYEITVENPTAYERIYRITDTLPKGVTYLSSDYEGEYKDGSIKWERKLPAKGKIVLTVTVRITQEEEDSITNKVMIETEGLDPNKETEETIHIQKAPVKTIKNLEGINKENQYLKLGEEYIYEVEINNPTSISKEYEFKDSLDEYVEYISSDQNLIYHKDTHQVTGKITIPSKETITLSIHVKPKQNGVKIRNIASVTVDHQTIDSNEVINYTPQPPIKAVSTEQEIEMNHSMVDEGDVLVYYIHVKNITDMVKKVHVEDALSSSLTFIEANYDGTYLDDKVLWDLTMIPTQEIVLSFKASVKEGQKGKEIKNQAKVLFDDIEVSSNPVENPVIKDPIKTVTIHGNDVDGKMVDVGKELTYTISFENVGATEKKVHIVDVLPDYTRYVSCSKEGTYHSDTRELEWDIIIQPHSTGSVSFVVETMRLGVYFSNIATVEVDTKEMQTNKVENHTPTFVMKGDLVSIYKNANPKPGTNVEGGQVIEYSLSIVNTGNHPSKNTIIYDALPKEVEYVLGSASHEGKYEDGILIFTIPEVKPLENQKITYQVKVKEDASGLIKNHAIYRSDTDQIDDFKSTNEVIHGIGNEAIPPTLEVRKTSPTAPIVKEGDEVTYHLMIVNRGGEVSKDTMITDVIPKGTKFVKSNEGIMNANKNRVEWYLGDLEPNETKTVSFTVKVIQNKGSIYNQANFDADIEKMNLSLHEPRHSSNITEHVIQETIQPNTTTKPMSEKLIVPNTGDTSHIGRYLLMAFTSVFVLVGLLYVKNKHSNHRG
ncbi:MAG: DUF11 domain-containing protein, partial [Solobacterium sp.]|nr:DUF11 domain-containing protein [Solobacterium sp.]